MGCIAYGHKNGIDFTRTQWDAALVREATGGESIRGDAERSVPRTDDRRMFDNDPDNRDRHDRDAAQGLVADATARLRILPKK
ncbi:hypothetical protein JQ596_15320 [Bradyrhizobium manausense]|uniref:hypothetical protein n=1 Tax=Bradyrhizobium TaxID=374 RepID=UPI001BADA3A1|nr:MULTISPECIES: hypothetical protein [Bradyrhizobium]MBR0826918.1 hypothetical protein [Bradyrhizobium manausense]UVO32200.1 hypothetical protein KUF59_16980 [Bradyrhizobium arachidis]